MISDNKSSSCDKIIQQNVGDKRKAQVNFDQVLYSKN
jgi:hypothetical protein